MIIGYGTQQCTQQFPTRFQQLFAGPVWSGAAQDDICNPTEGKSR